MAKQSLSEPATEKPLARAGATKKLLGSPYVRGMTAEKIPLHARVVLTRGVSGICRKHWLNNGRISITLNNGLNFMAWPQEKIFYHVGGKGR
jgi:hypothetical protein